MFLYLISKPNKNQKQISCNVSICSIFWNPGGIGVGKRADPISKGKEGEGSCSILTLATPTPIHLQALRSVPHLPFGCGVPTEGGLALTYSMTRWVYPLNWLSRSPVSPWFIATWSLNIDLLLLDFWLHVLRLEQTRADQWFGSQNEQC